MIRLKPIYKCRVCGEYTEDRIHCGSEAELFLDGTKRLMLSKLLSGILRHFPHEIGIKLEPGGWARIEDIVKGIREKWRNKELYQWVRPEHVYAVAILDPKGRFELSGNKIRARYGHSIRVNISYTEIRVDKPLYHGTSRENLEPILKEGIRSMKRLYVHLTIDPLLALETGKRHGKPVVLTISPECLSRHGIKVYKATDKIFLVEYVPPDCIIGVKEY
ncbi:MAG: RNA 2'-phosphotransferase [Thermoprotei archaeon]